MFRIVEKDDRFILYNTYTDALVTVMKKSELCCSENYIDELLNSDDFICFLKENCVYTDAKIDQNLLSIYMINKAKYSYGNLMITDALTYKCNLKCIYCMQQNTFKDVMELSPKDRVDIWKQIYDITASDSISIAFFGGEPFLNPSFIKKELEYAEELGLNLKRLTCITNGINASDDVIELINKYDFEQLQITIDGLPDTHNKRRISKEKINCFEKIIGNIDIFLEKTNVNIIINTVLDKKNIHEYKKLVDYFGEKFGNDCKGKDSRIIFNVGQECHPAKKSEYTIESIASADEYSDAIYNYLNYLIDNGYRINQPLPSPICINRKENDLIISPDGDVYKCISGMGNEEFLLITKEELKENPMTFHIRQACLLEREINPLCRHCEYMSMCNGGCEYNAFNDGVAHSCNKAYLEKSIDKIICLLEKIQRINGELQIWVN